MCLEILIAWRTTELYILLVQANLHLFPARGQTLLASRTEALELIGLGLHTFFNVYDHMMTEWDSVLWLHPSTRARVQMTCNLH